MWLTEILVALLFVQLVSLGTIAFSRAALGLLRVYEARREAIQTNVLALDMFAREWRIAGYSAAAQPVQGILAATHDSIELGADLDGDGATSGTHERISYHWDGARQAVMRATQGASPQPWLIRVPEGGFSLTYLSEFGEPLSPTTVTPELVAGIRISVQTAWEARLPEPTLGDRFTAAVVVARRNR